MSNYITLAQLATELGMDRSNLGKYIRANGFSFTKIRTKESNNQLTLALTEGDAESIRQLRTSLGFHSNPKPIENGDGYFYVIQVVPDLDTNRVKLGFASNVNARLATYKTSSPSATLLKSWPCRVSWERAAMDSITRAGCSQIGIEVFTCDDLDRLVRNGDSFFKIMPK